MLALISRLHAAAPAGSVFVVEADEGFDFAQLPRADRVGRENLLAGQGGHLGEV